MKKSLIALLVVLSLIVTVSVFSVSADGETEATSPAPDYSLETGVCPHCNVLWSEIQPTAYASDSTISIAGADNTLHYYLADNVAHTSDNRAAGTDDTVVIHLNGHTLSYSGYVFNNWNSGSNLYLVADATNVGTVRTTGSHAAMRSSIGNVYSYNVNYERLDGSPPSGVAGGTIALQDSGQFHMYGGTINGVTASGNGGAVQITGGATFRMHSGTISGCSATNGGAVYIGKGTFEMIGGNIENCSATTTGGGVYVTGASSIFTMTGGTISGCYAPNAGGAYNQDGGQINLNGGAISGCYASTGSGGGIYKAGSGKVVVNGGTISGCYSKAYGGGIYATGSQYVKLQKGTIENSYCWGTQLGGNICVDSSVELTISGSTNPEDEDYMLISGGYTTDAINNVAKKPVGEVAGLIPGAGRGGNLIVRGSASLSMTGGVIENGIAPFGGNVCLEGTGTNRVISGGKIAGGYAKNGGNAHCQQGQSLTIENESDTVKPLIDDGRAVTYGGNIYITGTDATAKAAEVRTTLTMTGGTVSNGYSQYGAGVYVDAAATFTMSGGKLDDNATQYAGGSIRVGKPTSILRISGTAEITNGDATSGGNLFSNTTATINITGGTISNGTARSNEGGNISLTNGTLTLTNATVSGGTATSIGGNMHLSNVSVDGNITGCTFIGGTAGTNGGSVYTSTKDRVFERCTFRGAYATENDPTSEGVGGNATGNGGNLYVSSGNVTLADCNFSNGSAANGGNLYLAGGTVALGTADPATNVTISGGTANATDATNGYGGNIYNTIANLDISRATISDGSSVGAAANGAGGGNIYTTANMTIPAGYTLSGGVADSANGGNLYIDGGAVVTLQGTVSGGIATRTDRANKNFNGTGGNVYIKNGELIITGGTIDNPLVDEARPVNGVHAGNVDVCADGKLTMTSGTISNGYCGTNGGNIRNVGVLDITGGNISGGKAGNGGNVHTNSTKTSVIAGAIISGGNAANGGNLHLSGSGLTLGAADNKLTVQDGTANGNGGNININIYNLDISNTIIQRGKAVGTSSTNLGGGGNIYTGSSIVIPADYVLEGGVAENSRGGNLLIAGGTTTLRGTISGGTSLRVGTTYGGEGGNVYVLGAATGTQKLLIDGGTVTKAEESTDSVAQHGGNIFVSANAELEMTSGSITAGKCISFGGNVYVNGGTATVTGGTISNGTAGAGGNIYMNTGTTTIGTDADDTAANILIFNGTAPNGANVYIKNAASNFCMKGGKIDGNYKDAEGTVVNGNTTNGGAVFVESGTFTLTGDGLIDNCYAKTTGGAVYLSGSTSAMVMSNGTIQNCVSPAGGAVYTQNKAQVTMSNGTIQNCSSTGNGGGIYAAGGGVVDLTGGTIQNCSAAANGGGMYRDGSATTTVNGAKISGCYAKKGGNIFVNAGVMDLKSGTIENGFAHSIQIGGNICAENSATVKVSGDVLITGGYTTDAIDNVAKKPVGEEAGSIPGGGRGGNMALRHNAKLEMTGGTVSNGIAPTGGNICIEGNNAGSRTNAIEISGGLISGGYALNGGNIVVQKDVNNNNFVGAFCVSGTVRIENGTATTGNGGNINIPDGSGADVQFTGGTISGGSSVGLGGNIYNGASGAQFSNVIISNGVAGTKVVTDEAGTLGSPTTDSGRGGNIAIMANTTLTNCEIFNGESYSSKAGGGNVYIGNGAEITITNCEVYGGFAYTSGGNIQSHSGSEDAIITINGDSRIYQGVAHVGYGGNIANTNSTSTTKILGTTVVNGKGSRCHATAQYGNNIALFYGAMEIGENAKVINGKLVTNNRENTALTANEGVSVEADRTLTVSGNASIADNIFLRTKSTTVEDVTTVTNGKLYVADNFTGMARPTWQNNSFRSAIAYGVLLSEDAAATILNYQNKGSVLAVNTRGTGIPVLLRDDGAYQYTGFTAFQDSGEVDEKNQPIYNEVPLASLSETAGKENDYEYIKLYVNDDSGVVVSGFGTITLQSDLPIDLNNQMVNFVTNNHTLKALDYRTDGGVVASTTKFTVDDPTKVELISQNPTNGYYYLNIQGTDGKWTSNCVRVRLKQVSVRPEIQGTTGCGVYYKAEITANAPAATYITEYGVVAGLKPDGNDTQINEDFMNNENKWYKWTNKSVNITTAIQGEEFNSGLIRNIMNRVEFDAAENMRRGELDIVTKAYITVNIGGQDRKLLSEEVSYTMQQLVEKLDEKYATLNPSTDTNTMTYIENFFQNYVDTMKQWNTPNLREKFNVVVEANEAA